MKLLDLLVSELPALGGWPEGAHFVIQSEYDGELYFFNDGTDIINTRIYPSEISSDSPEIRKAEYIIALASSALASSGETK